jgi:tetratricopeptide (TPR) repeat protein
MARIGQPNYHCAGMALVVLGAVALSPVAGDDRELDARKRNQLAVQAALEEGLAHLQRGHYREAVTALEKRIAWIDGNQRYLMALRDAYAGLVRQLRKAGQHTEAQKYQGFLAILEPSTYGDRPASAPASTTPATMPRAATPQPPEKAPAATTPGNPAGIVGRGKVEQDDPFDASNKAEERISTGAAKELLDRAEREFSARHYESACKLYAEADRAEPGAVASCLGHWAYCRLFCVAQTLNQTDGEVHQVEELKREVETALRMAPRLDGFASRLLERIKDVSEPTVEVKHTSRQGTGWAKAETEHLLVYHTLSEQEAEKAIRIAEATRRAMTRKWFGEAAGAWSPRCVVYLHPTVKGYTAATGAAAYSPGHSTISLDQGRVVQRRVDLRCDDSAMLTATLPHEMTHIVLAGHFGRHLVPRWADEGMAVLSETRERIDLLLGKLSAYRNEGTLFHVGEMMRMEDYPAARRIGPFYAQAVSVVEFLCKKKDAQTFSRFLREGLDGGYEAALERHYGYRGFAELDRDWQQYAFGNAAVTTTAEKRR